VLIIGGVRVGGAVAQELVALVEAQARTTAELRGQVEQLQAEVAALKRQLGCNSRNSSQPPSVDGPAAPARRSTRRRSGRKPGKQAGTGGTSLGLVADPDEVIDHVPVACGAAAPTWPAQPRPGVVRRQVHDIPTITPTVDEHRLHRRRCACGHVTCAAAPAGVNAPASYGPNLRALASYLVCSSICWPPARRS